MPTNLFKDRYARLKDEKLSPEQMFKDFECGWKRGGLLPDNQRFEMLDAVEFTSPNTHDDKQYLENLGLLDSDSPLSNSDAVNTSDAPMWIPRVITNVIREAREPVLVGEKLLQRVDFRPGQVINLGSMGAFSGDFEMPEMGEYPEISIQYGEGTVIRNTGRQGCSIRFSPDIIRQSAFPVVEMHVKAVGRAMARAKEEKIFATILNEGQVAFNNTTPNSSIYGITSGMDLSGSPNGSFTMDDMMKMMIQIIHNGYMPNVMLVHTLTWLMWLQDPYLKQFAINSGGGVFYGGYSGNPVENNNWANGAQGAQGMAGGRFFDPASTPAERFSTIEATPNMPAYMNFGPKLTIIATPFLPYDEDEDITDIIMFDSNELGILAVEHDLQVSDWTDPKNDIYSVKLQERYALALAGGGQGVSVAKDVKMAKNEIILPAQATIAVDGTIDAPFDPWNSPYDATS